MAQMQIMDKVPICISRSSATQKPIERLIKLPKKEDHSTNYLLVEAILDYLSREEKKGWIAVGKRRRSR